jgi:hypothetical protein
LVEAGGNLQTFLDDGDQGVHLDGDPELQLNRILRSTEKGVDPQMLLGPFEEPDRDQALSERRQPMGLYRRGHVWWMNFSYHGQQVRASTNQMDRRAAELILGDTRRQLRDGAYRITLEERSRRFGELMERFLREHVTKKASQRSYVGYVQRLRAFFGDGTPLADITPRLIIEYKNHLFAGNWLRPRSIGIWRRSRKPSIWRCASGSGVSGIRCSRSRWSESTMGGIGG